jgi:hypothetical protein
LDLERASNGAPVEAPAGADGPRETIPVSDARVHAGFCGWEEKR